MAPNAESTHLPYPTTLTFILYLNIQHPLQKCIMNQCDSMNCAVVHYESLEAHANSLACINTQELLFVDFEFCV